MNLYLQFCMEMNSQNRLCASYALFRDFLNFQSFLIFANFHFFTTFNFAQFWIHTFFYCYKLCPILPFFIFTILPFFNFFILPIFNFQFCQLLILTNIIHVQLWIFTIFAFLSTFDNCALLGKVAWIVQKSLRSINYYEPYGRTEALDYPSCHTWVICCVHHFHNVHWQQIFVNFNFVIN